MEHLRRAVRSVIGYNSPIYRAASQLTNYASVVGTEGTATWRKQQQLSSREGQAASSAAVPLKLSMLEHPILLRPGTEDASTVISTVLRAEYGQLQLAKEPRWMIDAGAYIGDTSAYFLSRFKQLKIIALEPSQPTYEAAKANLAPYGNRVELLNQGLAGKAGRLRFSGANTGASLSDDGNEIDCTSVLELISRFKLDRIDILKMDIEGAEEGIFKTDVDTWLPHVDNVLIELHGPDCERVVLGALRDANFAIRQYRTVYYCSRTH